MNMKAYTPRSTPDRPRFKRGLLQNGMGHPRRADACTAARTALGPAMRGPAVRGPAVRGPAIRRGARQFEPRTTAEEPRS